MVFSENKELADLIHQAWDGDFLVTGDLAEVEAKDSSDGILIFFDWDFKASKSANQKLISQDNFVRVLMSASMGTQEFRKHQFTEESTHAYIKRPVAKEQLQELIQDLIDTHICLGGEGVALNRDTKNPEELTFVGMIRPTSEGKKK